METENGARNELPDEPERAHESEALPEGQTGASEAEQEEPASPSSEPVTASRQAEPASLSTDEADTSTATQPVEQLKDEQTELLDVIEAMPTTPDDEQADVTEEAQTSLDDEQEIAEVEQDATPLSDTQADELAAAGSVPARQKSKYTPWMQIVAVVVLLCVIGGIVFAVRQSTNGHGQTVLGTPTPIPPLTVTKWCTLDVAPGDVANAQVNLSKIVALSANDAWVLGSLDTLDKDGSSSESLPLLERWDGHAWNIVQTADTSALAKQLQGSIRQIPNATASGPASNAVELNDLAVLSDNNIWIVGQVSVSQMFHSKSPFFPGPIESLAGQPLIEHWDGHTWQIVASPVGASPEGFLNNTNQLTSISAISANDIWAMGTQISKDNTGYMLISGEDMPLVEHWDGTSWTEKQLPNSLQTQGVDSTTIQALSANDVWSFDEGVNFNVTSVQPVPFDPSATPGTSIIIGKALAHPTFSQHILHWDGQNWHEMQFPADLSKSVSLGSVSVIADNNIWVFGSEAVDANGTPVTGATQTGQLKYVSVVYHWDGTTWSKAATPDVAGANLNNVSVSAPNDYWLFGSTQKDQPLTEHWDGKAWRVVTLTTPANGSVSQVTVAGQRAWALVAKQKVDTSKDSQSVNTVRGVITLGPPDEAPEFVGMVLETNC